MSKTTLTHTDRAEMLKTFEKYSTEAIERITSKLDHLYPEGYVISDAERDWLTLSVRSLFDALVPLAAEDEVPSPIKCCECGTKIESAHDLCPEDHIVAMDCKRCKDCTAECVECESWELRDEMVRTRFGNKYSCKSCAVVCQGCDEAFATSDARDICDDSGADFNEDDFYCDACGETCAECATRQSTTEMHEHDSEWYCSDCTVTCDSCDEPMPESKSEDIGYSRYCEDCIDDAREDEHETILANAATALVQQMAQQLAKAGIAIGSDTDLDVLTSRSTAIKQLTADVREMLSSTFVDASTRIAKHDEMSRNAFAKVEMRFAGLMGGKLPYDDVRLDAYTSTITTENN